MKNKEKAYLAGAALVTAIGGAIWFYEKHKAPVAPTGPAPATLNITLAPGNVAARVNGLLTLALPSGATWQSVASGSIGTLALPVGFGTPVPLASTLFAQGPITFQWVDSSNHVQTSVVTVTG